MLSEIMLSVKMMQGQCDSVNEDYIIKSLYCTTHTMLNSLLPTFFTLQNEFSITSDPTILYDKRVFG
jgi:hypothetical protein